jgi:hypothetical protein
VLEDEADDTWTSGNITKQGARLKQLQKFTGSEKAALVLLTEEAERYGVKPFTQQIGVKPGSVGDKTTEKKAQEKPAENLSLNPWSKHFRGDEQTREARIASILKVSGTKLAENLARAAGTSVLRPLRK